jgi:hypothetical protein
LVDDIAVFDEPETYDELDEDYDNLTNEAAMFASAPPRRSYPDARWPDVQWPNVPDIPGVLAGPQVATLRGEVRREISVAQRAENRERYVRQSYPERRRRRDRRYLDRRHQHEHAPSARMLPAAMAVAKTEKKEEMTSIKPEEIDAYAERIVDNFVLHTNEMKDIVAPLGDDDAIAVMDRAAEIIAERKLDFGTINLRKIRLN